MNQSFAKHHGRTGIAATATLAELDFHKGETLLRLAGTYPTLLQVVKEQVQNALDSGATQICVYVNLLTRNYTVSDNGKGVSKEYFQQALKSVGKGIKEKNKLGRFGLGLISPLGKCESFSFISCPAPGTGPYLQWVLNTENIRRQKDTLLIPFSERRDLAFIRHGSVVPKGITPVGWRSQMLVQNFTRDKMLSALTVDSLEQGILDDFSEVMYKNKVTVAVEIIDEEGKLEKRSVKASAFSGKRLPEASFSDSESGMTQVRMFLVRKRDRGGRINIKFGEMYSDFRFSFANFARSFGAELLAKETIDGLRSGIFEGEILSEKATLNPSRTCFDKSDALLGLCIAIDRWFVEFGKKYLNEERERRSSERYQELGVRSMKVIEELLKSSENADLLKAIRSSFSFGTIGTGHTKPDVPTDGLQNDQSTSLRGGAGGYKERDGSNAGNGPSRHPKERPGHVPLSVQGPSGGNRRLVKGNSVGLQFSYEDFGASSDLWKLDCECGILSFNITHPLWVECDKDRKDWRICALQEFVAMQALTLETMPDPAWKSHQRLYADECVARFVQLLSIGAISKSIRTA